VEREFVELATRLAREDRVGLRVILNTHVSAFANQPGGGFFVFGVNNDGTPVGVRNHDYSEIIKRPGNIAREGVVASVAIDHSILKYHGRELLFIYIPESADKPV